MRHVNPRLEHRAREHRAMPRPLGRGIKEMQMDLRKPVDHRAAGSSRNRPPERKCRRPAADRPGDREDCRTTGRRTSLRPAARQTAKPPLRAVRLRRRLARTPPHGTSNQVSPRSGHGSSMRNCAGPVRAKMNDDPLPRLTLSAAGARRVSWGAPQAARIRRGATVLAAADSVAPCR